VTELKPYAPHEENIKLSAILELRAQGEIFFKFSLFDPNQAVVNGPRAGQWLSPVRAHGLWQTTCFESFFASGAGEEYWELNLSPRGEWNLYHFKSYRHPQPPAESADFEALEIHAEPGSLTARLRARAPLSKLRASLCAVIQTANGTHYYSTHHSGPKPDFHRADSFTLAKGFS
jgi:hypothetical protein